MAMTQADRNVLRLWQAYDRRPTDVEARVAKVLGASAHPLAISRLIELWPDVHVEVTHSDGYHDGVRSKVTRVSLFDRDPNGPEIGEQATGEARCRLDHDNWVKRRGITLAFNRAMTQVPRPSAG